MTDIVNDPKTYSLSCPAFNLPASPLLSEKTRSALYDYRQYLSERAAARASQPADSGKDLDAEERCALERASFYQGKTYQSLIQRYPVAIELAEIGGVQCEIFTPKSGTVNSNQVLINLHGGSFEGGSQTNSRLESMPVAALGRIKVISVDYRMAPENCFPAATDDVIAVYQTLLQDYSPECIGIYGSSSGAMLASQVLVRLQQQDLPLPAAVGLIAGGATRIESGDSVSIGQSMVIAAQGYSLADSLKLRYYESADLNSPEVTPSLSDDYMSAFPPTLCASSTRDFLLSSVLVTHRQLDRLGVEATLHVWEGLDHVFHYNPDLPETEELHRITSDFFQHHLGGKAPKDGTE